SWNLEYPSRVRTLKGNAKGSDRPGPCRPGRTARVRVTVPSAARLRRRRGAARSVAGEALAGVRALERVLELAARVDRLELVERRGELVAHRRQRGRDGGDRRDDAGRLVDVLLHLVDVLLQLVREVAQRALGLVARLRVGRAERLEVVDELA